jgi:HEAT repeat protein
VTRSLWLAALLALPLVGGGTARAQKKLPAQPAKNVKANPQPAAKAPAAPAAPALDLVAIRKELRSADGERAQDAVEKLAADASPATTDLLLDELSIGAPPRTLGLMLDALAPRKDPRTLDALGFYAHHRAPDVRKKAVIAAEGIADPRAGTLLIAALSDPARDVRAAAAHGIALRKDAAAAAPLLKLFKHGDESAIEALGAVGGPDTARELGELVAQNAVAFPMLADVLGDLLKRKDFGPDPIRVDVVNALGKIPGAEATTILKEYLAATATPEGKALPSHGAAEKVLAEREVK